jgi:hypothetical protein
MSNMDPTKKKKKKKTGDEFRTPACYSYIQSSPGKILAVIVERRILHKKSKIHCHLRYEYFVTVNQIVIRNMKFV